MLSAAVCTWGQVLAGCTCPTIASTHGKQHIKLRTHVVPGALRVSQSKDSFRPFSTFQYLSAGVCIDQANATANQYTFPLLARASSPSLVSPGTTGVALVAGAPANPIQLSAAFACRVRNKVACYLAARAQGAEDRAARGYVRALRGTRVPATPAQQCTHVVLVVVAAGSCSRDTGPAATRPGGAKQVGMRACILDISALCRTLSARGCGLRLPPRGRTPRAPASARRARCACCGPVL
jgi:hypothetical protein